MTRRGFSIEKVGAWMAASPARLSGFAGKKGVLAPGADADFVVFDPDTEWTVGPEHLHFRHKLSPYLGAKLRGRVLETWLRREQVYKTGEFIGEPHGRELVRS
jgi:allantoinase